MILLVACVLLVGCSLPRGAALQSEIVNAAGDDDAPFAVYPVNRDTVETYAGWPRWHGYVGWAGSTRGPASPVIRAGDRLDLVIWDSSQNSLLHIDGTKVVDLAGIIVAPDGSIFMPYLDKLYVAGQGPEDARSQIQDALSEVLPSAQVQIGYTAGASNSVSLVGGVAAPGSFPLPNRNFSVLNLISLGGGVPPGMRNPQVSLVRDGRTNRTSLGKLYDDASLDVVLRGGDKIIVEQDERFFQALGSSGREELIYFSKERINALEAVSLMGGINDSRADPKGVLILREYPKGQVRADGKGPSHSDAVFLVDLTTADGLFSAKRFFIHPGDVVLVTESPITKTQTIFGLIGSVFGIVGSAQNLSN
ncbi:polysaccharide biosynthesis/export family protein [Candidatus Rhodobacter oscarellae]|uniref:polysaccharide biosynthesis/export family protein n=1 Tax=Candidatus Rhodobacter oscarellae TaxID=1675527 RepID=UPI001F2E893F|nr:polysaccharide biosynthesis/export family protein [Candidatus Rhodobacter lobularis]